MLEPELEVGVETRSILLMVRGVLMLAMQQGMCMMLVLKLMSAEAALAASKQAVHHQRLHRCGEQGLPADDPLKRL
jgi:hypothetical protein